MQVTIEHIDYENFARRCDLMLALALADKPDSVRIAAFNYWHAAHRECKQRAAEYSLPVHVVAGIAAALSPNQSEQGMWMGVDRLLENTGKRMGYGRDWGRAQRIRETGTVEPFLPGRKTRSFYRNMLDPDNKDRIVTVDGHMVNIWRGELSVLNKVRINATLYDIIESAVRIVASELATPPSQLQALLWLDHKRRYGILDRPQMRLELAKETDVCTRSE